MEKQNGKQSLNEIHFIYKRKGLMRLTEFQTKDFHEGPQ